MSYQGNIITAFENGKFVVRYANGTPIFSISASTDIAFDANGTLSANGTVSTAPKNVTAAGATQLGATLLSSTKNVVTVAASVSTKGVRLPAAFTGLIVDIANLGSFKFNVYPFLGAKISNAATNIAAGTKIARGKIARFMAQSATQWLVQYSA